MIEFLILIGAFAATAAVAYVLISRIPQMLHTPLMAMTNAISAVTVLGALLLFARYDDALTSVVGALALVFALFNLVGGFSITVRMLNFFRKDVP